MRRMLRILWVTVVFTLAVPGIARAQEKVLLFDMSKGQTDVPDLGLLERYEELAGAVPGGVFRVNKAEITQRTLHGVTALIVLTPFAPPREPTSFTPAERAAIADFVRAGGRVVLVAEEDRRMNIETYGANDILRPFGLEFGAEDTPVRNNVGAIGLRGEISAARRELPYSGGRPVHGGIPLSIVNDEGGYVHMAYAELSNGGRIVAAGDAMVMFFLGSAEGQRLSGAGGARGDAVTSGQPAAGRPPASGASPASGAPDGRSVEAGGRGRGFALATRFWGKDSEIFMRELIAWLLK